MRTINGIYKFYFKSNSKVLKDAPKLWHQFDEAFAKVNKEEAKKFVLEKPMFIEMLESLK